MCASLIDRWVKILSYPLVFCVLHTKEVVFMQSTNMMCAIGKTFFVKIFLPLFRYRKERGEKKRERKKKIISNKESITNYIHIYTYVINRGKDK